MVSRVLNPAYSLPTAPPEGFRPGFIAVGTLRYRAAPSAAHEASVGGLKSRPLSARPRLTGELLRTL